MDKTVSDLYKGNFFLLLEFLINFYFLKTKNMFPHAAAFPEFRITINIF